MGATHKHWALLTHGLRKAHLAEACCRENAHILIIVVKSVTLENHNHRNVHNREDQKEGKECHDLLMVGTDPRSELLDRIF